MAGLSGGMGLLTMSAWMLYHCVGISSSVRKKRFCLVLIVLMYVMIVCFRCRASGKGESVLGRSHCNCGTKV